MRGEMNSQRGATDPYIEAVLDWAYEHGEETVLAVVEVLSATPA